MRFLVVMEPYRYVIEAEDVEKASAKLDWVLAKNNVVRGDPQFWSFPDEDQG